MSANSSSRIIRFSTFEVNLHTGELRPRGQKVKLPEQPLQVLAALLERPGEMVTREELCSKLCTGHVCPIPHLRRRLPAVRAIVTAPCRVCGVHAAPGLNVVWANQTSARLPSVSPAWAGESKRGMGHRLCHA